MPTYADVSIIGLADCISTQYRITEIPKGSNKLIMSHHKMSTVHTDVRTRSLYKSKLRYCAEGLLVSQSAIPGIEGYNKNEDKATQKGENQWFHGYIRFFECGLMEKSG
jgi:hypothetical protein